MFLRMSGHLDTYQDTHYRAPGGLSLKSHGISEVAGGSMTIFSILRLLKRGRSLSLSNDHDARSSAEGSLQPEHAGDN